MALISWFAYAPEARASLQRDTILVWSYGGNQNESAHAELKISADHDYDLIEDGSIIAGLGNHFTVSLENIRATPAEATIESDGIFVNGMKYGQSAEFDLEYFTEIIVHLTYVHVTETGIHTQEQNFIQRIYPARAVIDMRTADQGEVDHSVYSTSAGGLHPDIFNTTFNVTVLRSTGEGWDQLILRENVETRVSILGTPFGESDEKSAWGTTNASGEVALTLGSGTESMTGTAIYHAPELYIKVEPLMPDLTRASSGYAAKLLKSHALRNLDGKLTIKPRDPGGRLIYGKVTVWGGRGGYFTTKTSDKNGAVPTIHWPKASSKAEDKTREVTLFPIVTMTGDKTQNLDNPSSTFDIWPYYLSPHTTLNDDAYTYKANGLKNVRLKLVDTNDPLTVYKEFTPNRPIKLASEIKLNDRFHGRDRQYLPVDVPSTARNYRLLAVFDDSDEGAQSAEFIAGSADFRVVKTHEPRKPLFNFWYVMCRVGAWTVIGGKIPVSKFIGSSNMIVMTDELRQFLPAGLVTSFDPSFSPKSGAEEVFSFSSEHLEALAQSLQAYQGKSKGKIDLVIGLMPPGYLHTHSLFSQGGAAGLSFDSSPNVILLDQSLTKKHHALHEFLHTLGLPDKDDDVHIAPSANGLDGKDPVINLHSLSSYPQYEAIMYDDAMNPFPDTGEYRTIIEYAAKAVSGSSPRQGPPPSPTGKVITLRGTITGTTEFPTVNIEPPFVSEGVPLIPRSDYGDYYARVRRQNGENLIAYFNVAHPNGNPYGEIWNTDRIVSFYVQLPWYDDLTDIDIGPSNELGGMIASWKNVKPSAHAPSATVTGPVATTLSGIVDLTWNMSDADAEVIHAMPMISPDNGATWKPVVMDIPYSADAGGNYSVPVNCAYYPNGSQYKFRVLVTDGFHTTEAVSASTYTLSGYDPDPVLELPLASIDARVVPSSLSAQVILPIRNAGRSQLVVTVDEGALPSWLRLDFGRNPISLVPGEEALFSLSAARPMNSATQTTVNLISNDPDLPNAAVPVRIESDGDPITPSLVWTTVDPPQDPDKQWLNDTPFRITAYESTGAVDLDARITIALQNPYRPLVDRQPMAPGLRVGAYTYLWDPGGVAGEGQYGVEITALDPETGLADYDGSVAENWDAVIRLKEPNLIPNFVTPPDPVTTVQGEVGKEVVIPYEVVDPDGDAVEVALHDLLLPVRWDKTAGEIRLTPRSEYTDVFYMTAIDEHQAMRTIEIHLDIGPGSDSPIATVTGTGIIDGKIFGPGETSVTIPVLSQTEGQQGVRLEYRRAGETPWTVGNLIAYNEVDLGYMKVWMANVVWDLGGFPPGSEIEVRVVNIDGSGVPDPNAAILHVYTHSMTGELTTIEAPSIVEARQAFTMKVNFVNHSPYLWTSSSDVILRPLGGNDPFTPETTIQMPGLMQLSKDSSGYFEIFAVAPDAPGDYVTDWELVVGGSGMTPTVSKTIKVIQRLVLLDDLINYVLGRTQPSAEWLGRADLNGDGLIDSADIVLRGK